MKTPASVNKPVWFSGLAKDNCKSFTSQAPEGKSASPWYSGRSLHEGLISLWLVVLFHIPSLSAFMTSFLFYIIYLFIFDSLYLRPWAEIFVASMDGPLLDEKGKTWRHLTYFWLSTHYLSMHSTQSLPSSPISASIKLLKPLFEVPSTVKGPLCLPTAPCHDSPFLCCSQGKIKQGDSGFPLV